MARRKEDDMLEEERRMKSAISWKIMNNDGKREKSASEFFHGDN